MRARWTEPQRVVTLHGYLRTRGWLLDNFSLGRNFDVTDPTRRGYPFTYFIPIDRGGSTFGGCGDGAVSAGATGLGTCYSTSDQMRWADMRLRLQPTISISDEVRVHMMIDAFDNMVLGSTPDSDSMGALVSNATSSNGVAYYPGLPADTFTTTQNPPSSNQNSLQGSIVVRRAWAEVGNHSIGQLRFGRMGNHWGLGMVWNGGAGLDSDYQTDVDRFMGMTRIKGFTLGAAWDFANSGVTAYPNRLNGIAYDPTNKDDLKQFAFFAGQRLEPEEQRRRLEEGRWVLNYGVYFQFQSQHLSYLGPVAGGAAPSTTNPVATSVYENTFPRAGTGSVFFDRDATVYTVDGWGQFLWRDLRVELEVATHIGDLRWQVTQDHQGSRYKLQQWGYAFEAEYKLLDRRLGIALYQGYASGDADVVGLSTREDLVTQQTSDKHVTTFAFHPNYRIDLILFRNILGQIAGVTYFKPGVSYDILRSDYGRLLGVRLDVVYSRANRGPQAYGADPNLGVEIDGSIYYRTEDGPDLLDGVYLGANYGILFPLDGLGYAPGQLTGVTDNTRRAQVFRLLMGVQF